MDFAKKVRSGQFHIKICLSLIKSTPVVVTGGKFNTIPRRCYGIKFQHDQLTIPEKRILFERRCSLLQVRLNLTSIFSLPYFLYNPSRASYIQCRLTKGFLSIGANVLRCCAALSFKALPPTSGMDLKEEDLLINLASMSRKCWWTFTTFKTR